LKKQIPLGRDGRAEEISACVVYGPMLACVLTNMLVNMLVAKLAASLQAQGFRQRGGPRLARFGQPQGSTFTV
jgi:hypothetical protein